MDNPGIALIIDARGFDPELPPAEQSYCTSKGQSELRPLFPRDPDTSRIVLHPLQPFDYLMNPMWFISTAISYYPVDWINQIVIVVEDSDQSAGTQIAAIFGKEMKIPARSVVASAPTVRWW